MEITKRWKSQKDGNHKRMKRLADNFTIFLSLATESGGTSSTSIFKKFMYEKNAYYVAFI